MMNEKKDKVKKIIIVVGWLLLWQILSLCVENGILLTGPMETVQRLAVLSARFDFWQACGGSLFRISIGFGLGMLLGILLAMGSARYKLAEEILAPPMMLIKAVPVASFVVLFLIWWGSKYLAIGISFCVVLPIFFVNTLEGIRSTDKKLLEMAHIFDVTLRNRFFYIYRPALKPFWDGAIRTAVGMSWKSGVAAEVIGLPEHAIGEQLYLSKIYLDTSGVLAWTIVIVIMSLLFERVILWLWKWIMNWQPACKSRKGAPQRNQEAGIVRLKNICKEYDGKKVINGLHAEYKPGNVYYFEKPSGSGKTTLFRLLAGLETMQEGSVALGTNRISYLFQEDRLCEDYSALKNVELVTGDVEIARTHLLQLLDEEHIYKPCGELSGGMRRRVALARTMAVQAQIFLLDEPYNGLDEANRERVKQYIHRNSKGGIVLIASHIE